MLTNEEMDHFKIADKVCERAKRGLPQDRWMRGNHEMKAMVKAYMDMTQIVQNLHNEIVQRGLESMSMGEPKKGADESAPEQVVYGVNPLYHIFTHLANQIHNVDQNIRMSNAHAL